MTTFKAWRGKLPIFAALLLLPSLSLASAGTEGASFLDIPVGAGPAAMGAAYTAMATNAYAPIYNPAGLASLSGNEIAGQHLSYLESIHYEFLSIVHPFNKPGGTRRGIGLSVQYLGSGDIDKTDVDASGNPINNGDPIGTFSSNYASYNLSYGQSLTEKLSVGVTGKMIRAKIDDVSASAFAADLGTHYRLNAKAQIAASLVNLGSKLKFLSAGDSLPMAFRLGGAYRPVPSLALSTEGEFAKTGEKNIRFGTQWRPMEMVSLRVGYRTDTLEGLSALAGFSTGMGLHLWGQEFAYAWTPYGDLGDTQYFSLVVHFGGAEERRNLIQYQTLKRDRVPRPEDVAEPEYQQLMQLLGDTDDHFAESPTRKAIVDR